MTLLVAVRAMIFMIGWALAPLTSDDGTQGGQGREFER